MNVLVTGCAGFIGSHLVDTLLARGDHVVGVDEFNDYYDPAVKRHNLTGALTRDAFRLHEADIRDSDAMLAIAKEARPDVIVHLAARAGVRPSLEQPILYEEVNCRGTLNMLEAARLAEVPHFVFASSSSVYGNCTTVPFSEAERIDRPISPYAATKAAGELYCYNYHHLYGITTTALRFFTAYGPRGRPDMAIHKFARLMTDGAPIPFYGDGSTRRDYTYIGDIVEGVVAAIDKPLGYDILNLGESHTTSLSELVQQLEEALGLKAERNMLPMQPGDVDQTYADISRAQEQLGYRPSTPVEVGIPLFVEWFREREGSA